MMTKHINKNFVTLSNLSSTCKFLLFILLLCFNIVSVSKVEAGELFVFSVKKEGCIHYGYIDNNGDVIIPAIYTYATTFSAGYAFVMREKQSWYVDQSLSIINSEGAIVGKVSDNLEIPGDTGFRDGFCVVKQRGRTLTHKYGFINSKGQLVINCKYSNAFSFSGGLSAVEVGGKHVSMDFLDKYNKTDITSTKNEGLWGFINKEGQWHIDPKYVFVTSFSQKGIAVAVNREGVILSISEDGNTIATLPFDKYGSAFIKLNGDRVVGKKNNKWGVANVEGAWIVEPTYDYIGKYSCGLARVYIDGAWGYLNKKGEMSIEPSFCESYRYCNGYAIVGTEGVDGHIRKAVIDTKGDTVIQQIQHSVSPYITDNQLIRFQGKSNEPIAYYSIVEGKFVFVSNFVDKSTLVLKP